MEGGGGGGVLAGMAQGIMMMRTMVNGHVGVNDDEEDDEEKGFLI